jgi:hypothetical protein
MSDVPQGPDWWQASDDKWYPPPRPEMPGDTAATAVASPGMVAPGGPPSGPPLGPPTGPPSGGFPTGPPTGGFPGGPPSGGFPPDAPPSPYGGMPPAAPPPGQNRTPLYVAIGVVVAAALVGLIVVLSSGDDGGTTSATTAPEPPTTTADGTTDTTGGDTTDTTGGSEPSGNGQLQVVETGFSNFMGGFDRDEKSVAYGFIVENTGDETATDISVSVSAYDAGGTALASDSFTIYVLRPGEKMGIGDEFYGTTFTADVDSIDVQVSEPSEFGSQDVPDEGGLTAEGITTTPSDYDISTTFTATSTYGQQIDSPSAYAIYRDASGAIIGGSTGYLDFIAANGSTAGEVTSWDLIPNVASTEIYLDPGWFG